MTPPILKLIETLKVIPKPLVFHYKSGADRTGFVVAIYLITCENVLVGEAKNS